MNRLAKLIEKMAFEDLLRLQKDLRGGNLDKLINGRIDNIKPTQVKYCPVCNSDVNSKNLTLIFGPPNFRQRASFDGPDCLSYFLEKLRKKGEE